MDDEKLVEAVRDFECLWKVGCKSYKDIKAKENAWKEVAFKVSKHIIVILIMQVMKVLIIGWRGFHR